MRRQWDDRGSSPIQLAILFPAVILITFLLIQGVLWAYAQHRLHRRPFRSGRRPGSTRPLPGDAARRAHGRRWTILAGNMLTGTQVSTAGSSPDTMRVRVGGQALSMLPGFHLTVHATVTGPIPSTGP
ncbi:TadE family protein [Streptomyces sp. KL116D]|uniref:TadE family protein n=1 Tax=Streptomyces sp. KL116D TaxID=3045152 RepID=UPI003556B3D4